MRVVQNLGFTADVAGLTASGLFDPVLTHVLDEAELDDVRETAQTTSYLAGGASIALSGVSSLSTKVLANADAPATSSTNFANYGGEFVDDGLAGTVSQIEELSPAQASRLSDLAAEAAETNRLMDLSDTLREAALVGVGQRAVGVGLDQFDFGDGMVAPKDEAEDE